MPTRHTTPPQAYQEAVFTGQAPEPSVLVSAGRRLADYEKDRTRFERRQAAAQALSDAERERAKIAAADPANRRELQIDARFRRSQAVAALQQTAAPELRANLQRLVAERAGFQGRCDQRRAVLEVLGPLADQRKLCEALATADGPAAARDYEAALEKLRALEALRARRSAAGGEEQRDREKLAELAPQIDAAERALLDPQKMTWEDDPWGVAGVSWE